MVNYIDGVKIGCVEDYNNSNIIQAKKILKKTEMTSEGIPAKPPDIEIKG